MQAGFLIPDSCIFDPCSSKRGSRIHGPLTQIQRSTAKGFGDLDSGIQETGYGVRDSGFSTRAAG